jgi:RNA recognition motif-containing protein
MSTKLHVANLSPAVDGAELARLFAAHGPVLDARVTTHPHSGRSTATAIVEMASEVAGDAAIAALDGRELAGRPLAVAPATPRDETNAAGTSLFGPMNVTADDEVARRGG